MTPETIQLPHKLTLNERKSLTMTGVTEVVSFDESTILLRTVLGTLEIQGDRLQLKMLSIDGGQVAVEGHICALLYEEPKPEGGFFRRWLG